MSTTDDLYKEAEMIQSYLECTLSDEPEEVKIRGDTLIEYIARTGKMLADAKFHLNRVKRDEAYTFIQEILEKGKVSAKLQNAICDSLARDEQYLVDWIERLHRSATHQMEWCRTKLSYYKAELNLQGGYRQ